LRGRVGTAGAGSSRGSAGSSVISSIEYPGNKLDKPSKGDSCKPYKMTLERVDRCFMDYVFILLMSFFWQRCAKPFMPSSSKKKKLFPEGVLVTPEISRKYVLGFYCISCERSWATRKCRQGRGGLRVVRDD
jgi:hypothetical protein